MNEIKQQLTPLWNNLKTSVDQYGYQASFKDPKSSNPSTTVFVEEKDPFAINFYKTDVKAFNKNFGVEQISNIPDVTTVNQFKNKPGLVSSVLINDDKGVRATPYTYLGDGFTELDVAASYFHILGLINARKIEQAKQIIGNIIYMVGHTHSLKATNRIYHQHVRALPLYTAMVRAIAVALPKEEQNTFLKIHITRSILDYFRNWHSLDTQMVNGLNIYPKTQVDANTLSFEIPSYTIIPVRINMMLYKTEKDIAHFIGAHTEDDNVTVEGIKYNEAYWNDRANQRLEQMQEVLWNRNTNTFNDFDSKEQKHTHLSRADFIYALWAEAITNNEQLEQIKNQLDKHSTPFGLQYDLNITTAQASEQIIAWLGLEHYKVKALDNVKGNWQQMVLKHRTNDEHPNLTLHYNIENGAPLEAIGNLYGWTLTSVLL